MIFNLNINENKIGEYDFYGFSIASYLIGNLEQLSLTWVFYYSGVNLEQNIFLDT